MRHSRSGRAGRLFVAALAATLVATGCATREGGEGTEEAPAERSHWEPGMINITDGGEPTPGGELVFGAMSEPRSLDPAMTITAGPTGGTEMSAIYDVLMRWDSDTGELVPQLAESLESNDEFTEWTLKLREGVNFSNGEPLDAEAVVWSLERYMQMPTDEAKMWAANVTNTEIVDERTITFTLSETWPTFGYMLSTAPGMIVGEGSDGASPADFKPIGAGPYVLERHAPGEEIVLTARDDYWRGAPNIKTIRSIFLGDPNSIADSFDNGTVSMAMLNSPELADRYLNEKVQGFLNMVPLGRVAIINATEGRPGEDVRVRKAMQLAIDPQVLAERTFKGAGYPSDEIFPEISSWHTGAEALGYDPEEAKKLVEEAKAEGFDGKMTYTFVGTPSGREQAFAIKAQLDAVGFETELENLRTTPDLIKKVLIDRDYDLSTSGMSWREAEPWARMAATGHSTGNTSGTYTSPEMDALIDEFKRARTKDEAKEVAGRIQEQWNENVPALVFGPGSDFVIWNENVHGVKSHINAMVLFDEAWISQN